MRSHVRRWQRRRGRARSHLFCTVPTVFVGHRWDYWSQRFRLLIVARWGFWEASVETWREAVDPVQPPLEAFA